MFFKAPQSVFLFKGTILRLCLLSAALIFIPSTNKAQGNDTLEIGNCSRLLLSRYLRDEVLQTICWSDIKFFNTYGISFIRVIKGTNLQGLTLHYMYSMLILTLGISHSVSKVYSQGKKL